MTKANDFPSNANATLLLSRDDLAGLLTPADYLEAVERGFRAVRDGRASAPPPMHVPAEGGGFHAKAALLRGERNYAALKLNGNFPGNPGRGLPTIQGAILLCDADNGAVLAILDSIEITLRRTAAATALAAKHLARPGAASFAICGCGAQARPQAEALLDALPLTRGCAWDIDPARARGFAEDMDARFGCRVEATHELGAATRSADIIVTCTTARTPFLSEAEVAPGAFIAAIGADNPDKSEIAPALMARAVVVVDALDQCAHMGDLHHAIAAGLMTADQVRGALGDIVAGARPGRLNNDEIIIFDSTGTAVQDVASAALAYERACAAGRGLPFSLARGA